MNFDHAPIICQTFGVGLTVDDNDPAMFILMGEEEGEPPTHGVLMDAATFSGFVNRCLALAIEINGIQLSLEGLEGEERRAALSDIQERYSAGLN
jgi:hypothetical protein